MLVDEMRAALAAAPRERLCDLSKALWQAFAAGAVSEAEAEELSGLIEARRAVAKSIPGSNKGAPVRLNPEGVQDTPGRLETGNVRSGKFALPPRKPQRPPVRSVAIERRRRLAASGPMPPALAARYTTGELAVLRIVADEFRDRGSCTLCLDAIAARAGVSRSLAKGAIRQARRLGMVEVVERRRVGAKSLPNVVTVVDKEWLAWIARGKRIGGRNLPTTETGIHLPEDGGSQNRGRATGRRMAGSTSTNRDPSRFAWPEVPLRADLKTSRLHIKGGV